MTGFTHRIFYYFVGLAIIACYLLVEYFVPWLIAQAYNQSSFSFINNLIVGRNIHSLPYYLNLWEGITGYQFWVFIIISAVIVCLIVCPRRQEWFFEHFIQEDGPESLALIRIFVCGILSIHMAWENLASSALLPRKFIHHEGFMRLLHILPGFDELLSNYIAVNILEQSTQFLLLLGLFGYKTCFVLPLATLGYFIMGGILREISWFTHIGIVPFNVLVILSFVSCADAWSLDKYFNRNAQNAITIEKKADYGWARYVCWAVIAWPYLQSGLSKVSNGGFLWWHPDNIRKYMLTDSLMPMQFDWQITLHFVEAPDVLFAFVGLTGILGELLFISVLFSRFCRVIMPIFMIAMHLGIFFLQNILFFDLIILQLIFPLHEWLQRKKLYPSKTIIRTYVKRPTHFQSTILAGLTILFLFLFIFSVEQYPFTAFQMYSQKLSSNKINYFKILSYGEDGTVGRGYPENAIPALRDTRYRVLFGNCFRSREYQQCQEFLEICGIIHNKKNPTKKIQKFEALYIEWDYKATPRDPNYGKIIQKFGVNLKKG